MDNAGFGAVVEDAIAAVHPAAVDETRAERPRPAPAPALDQGETIASRLGVSEEPVRSPEESRFKQQEEESSAE